MTCASRVLTPLLVLVLGLVDVAHGQQLAGAPEPAPFVGTAQPLCELWPMGPPCKRVAIALSLRAGAAEAPFFTETLPTASGHGFIAGLSTTVDLPRDYLVGGSLPFALMSIEQPGGSYVDELAFGNASVFAGRVIAHERKRATRHASFVELGLGLPVAEHDTTATLPAARALTLANALESYRSPEAYTSGVIPVVPSFGHRLRYRRLTAHAELRLPLLFRFSDGGMPERVQTRHVGVASILHSALLVRLSRKVEASLAADTVVNAIEPVRPANDTPRVQFSLSPAFRFKLGQGVRLGMSFLAPVGGALGGKSYSGCLSLASGF